MKKIFTLLLGLFSFSSQATDTKVTFPPVPKWKPDFSITIDQVLDRMRFYTNNSKDILLFKYGTAVIIPDDLTDKEAGIYANKVLSEIYNYHPDMNPQNMEDGNILIKYNHPAFNVVISEYADKHKSEIIKNHLDALATDEVLITPLGNNKFDDFGMKALYGRAFMFMDALSPNVVKIYKHKASKNV